MIMNAMITQNSNDSLYDIVGERYREMVVYMWVERQQSSTNSDSEREKERDKENNGMMVIVYRGDTLVDGDWVVEIMRITLLIRSIKLVPDNRVIKW